MIEQLRKRLLDRDNPVRIHLIGVAGAGMSGIARMLFAFVISCDQRQTLQRETLGVGVYLQQ